MHPQTPVTSIIYWWNCAEGLWWPDIWGVTFDPWCLHTVSREATFLVFSSSFSRAWYLEALASMCDLPIDCSFRDACAVLSSPLCSTVWLCGAQLLIGYEGYWWTVCGILALLWIIMYPFKCIPMCRLHGALHVPVWVTCSTLFAHRYTYGLCASSLQNLAVPQDFYPLSVSL